MCKNRQLWTVLMCFVLMGWLAPAVNAQGPVADGLVFWLDASKASDLELSGDKVTRWDDRSGNSYYAEQTDVDLQPTYLRSGLNGKGTVDFGDSVYGSVDQPWMQFCDASGADLNISTIRTVFWVAGMDEGSNGFLLGDDNNYHFHRGTENQIWDGANGWAHANVRNGSTYLNGVEVDGTATVLPTDYSIISLITAGNVEASALTLDRTYRTGGIKLGELLIYDRALTDDERLSVEAYLYQKWMVPGAASDGVPANDSTDVLRDTALSWTAGLFAATHDVYFGTVFDDVNDASRDNPLDVLASQGQSDTTYTPPTILEYGQTYYWRIDEVNAAPDNTIFKGEVWNFIVEPIGYPVENITATSNGVSVLGASLERVVDGSGLNENDEHSVDSGDMWAGEIPAGEALWVQFEFDMVLKLYEMLVWNYNVEFENMLGFGFKDVTVEYSTDGVDWTVLGDFQFAQAISSTGYTANTTIDFAGAAVQYVRLIVNSTYSGGIRCGLSEVRFLSVPVSARNPEPADGAADINVATTLDWRAGRQAVSHEVYLGTDPEALAPAGTASGTSYAPGTLDLATTYYWKVDEVNEAEAISVWEGSLWSFTTQALLVVDDFESYNDEDNLIYDVWEDGWYNGTGSTVGYFESPFAEQDIVKSGSQSMPLFYDNAAVDTAEAEFALDQDWTASGIQSLSLYFYGDLENTGGQLFVKINDTKVVYDGPAVNIMRPAWQHWNIDLSTVGANLSSVTSLTIGVEGAGATGTLYIDDVQLHPEVLEYLSSDITGAGDTVQGVPNDDDWPAAEYPALAIDDNVETKYLHRKGGSTTTGFQVEPLVGATIVTGLTFTSANDDYGRDPTSFELYGSNDSIDGPYELIASGAIVDFSQDEVWPRHTKTETPIEFENTVAYTYYQVLFPTVDRSNNDGLMQIAEVELLGVVQ